MTQTLRTPCPTHPSLGGASYFLEEAMKTYRRKPSPTFEAIQYTPENRDAIVATLKARTFIQQGSGDELIIVDGCDMDILHPGDWLIRDHDGSYRRASDDVFRATYEEVES